MSNLHDILARGYIREFGEDRQINATMAACAALIVAVTQEPTWVLDATDPAQRRLVDANKVAAAVVDNITNVMLLMWQMRLMFGADAVDACIAAKVAAGMEYLNQATAVCATHIGVCLLRCDWVRDPADLAGHRLIDANRVGERTVDSIACVTLLMQQLRRMFGTSVVDASIAAKEDVMAEYLATGRGV